MRHPLPFAVVLFVTGCSSPQPVTSPSSASTVLATVETAPVDTAEDAADDPAIWQDAENPANSLIIGTDKRAGIHIYDLAGKRVGFTPSPRLNNVDLRSNVKMAGTAGVLVAASDRQNEASAQIAIFRLDSGARKLVPLATIQAGSGEAYGMCLWLRKADAKLFGFVITKTGKIYQVEFDLAEAKPSGKVVRSMKLATQAEGCVVDDRTGILYVAEEDVGIWRFDAEPTASNKPTAYAKVDDKTLVADIEGLALAPEGDRGGYLVASSQGDNAYSLFNLQDGKYTSRFRIADGPSIDGTSDTDGIDLMLGDFGPNFPDGLFVAQDGDNAPETQNFKLVPWNKIVSALSKP